MQGPKRAGRRQGFSKSGEGVDGGHCDDVQKRRQLLRGAARFVPGLNSHHSAAHGLFGEHPTTPVSFQARIRVEKEQEPMTGGPRPDPAGPCLSQPSARPATGGSTRQPACEAIRPVASEEPSSTTRISEGFTDCRFNEARRNGRLDSSFRAGTITVKGGTLRRPRSRQSRTRQRRSRPGARSSASSAICHGRIAAMIAESAPRVRAAALLDRVASRRGLIPKGVAASRLVGRLVIALLLVGFGLDPGLSALNAVTGTAPAPTCRSSFRACA